MADRSLYASINTADNVKKEFTTPDIDQQRYLLRQEGIRMQDLKDHQKNLKGGSGKRTSDMLNLGRYGIYTDMTGMSPSGGVKTKFPSEPGNQLHHGNQVFNTASIYRSASQAELNILWSLQNKLKVPTGNDIRNLFELNEGQHQKGKRVGQIDAHQWARDEGLTEDYLKGIKNPTLKQRVIALRRMAKDWHTKIRPKMLQMQFDKNQLNKNTKAVLDPSKFEKGQRYVKDGAFYEAVIGNKDVHLLEPGRSTLTIEESKARQQARKTKGETIRRVAENNPGFFAQPERPGHDAAVDPYNKKAATEKGRGLGGSLTILRNTTKTKTSPKSSLKVPKKMPRARMTIGDDLMPSKDTFYDPGGYAPPIGRV